MSSHRKIIDKLDVTDESTHEVKVEQGAKKDIVKTSVDPGSGVDVEYEAVNLHQTDIYAGPRDEDDIEDLRANAKIAREEELSIALDDNDVVMENQSEEGSIFSEEEKHAILREVVYTEAIQDALYEVEYVDEPAELSVTDGPLAQQDVKENNIVPPVNSITKRPH